jgi:hypothetical protein
MFVLVLWPTVFANAQFFKRFDAKTRRRKVSWCVLLFADNPGNRLVNYLLGTADATGINFLRDFATLHQRFDNNHTLVLRAG